MNTAIIEKFKSYSGITYELKWNSNDQSVYVFFWGKWKYAGKADSTLGAIKMAKMWICEETEKKLKGFFQSLENLIQIINKKRLYYESCTEKENWVTDLKTENLLEKNVAVKRLHKILLKFLKISR